LRAGLQNTGIYLYHIVNIDVYRTLYMRGVAVKRKRAPPNMARRDSCRIPHRRLHAFCRASRRGI
jgi:hypothetical protein